jgi:hypothetical protein
MPDPNGNTNDDTGNNNANGNPGGAGTDDQSMVEKLVADRVDEALKDIKKKLDNAYAARDEANRKAAELEQKEKEARLARLAEEGKHNEVLEARLAEANAKLDAVSKANTELSRDVKVREALGGLPFRNDRAAEIAYKEIVGTLVQDDNGVWKHKSGVTIKEFVEIFSKDEEQSFLFKAKSSSGSGTNGTNPDSAPNKQPSSLFAMSQEEVLKLAREGKLPKRK